MDDEDNLTGKKRKVDVPPKCKYSVTGCKKTFTQTQV